MTRGSVALYLLAAWVGGLHAQTPTITSVVGEAGTAPVCPGGIGFVRGTNLGGTSTVVTVGTRPAYVFNAANGANLQLQFPVDAPLGATTLKAGNSAPFDITLVQYCPGMPVDNGIAHAIHLASGIPVTAAFPATPNEQIAIAATGLGPTNPVFGTGTAPDDNSAVVVTKPTLTLGAQSVPVTTAYLQRKNPGFYAVVFTVPADVTAGNQPVRVSIGGLTSNAAPLPVATGPVVGLVTNAASYISVGPSRGIAQGAIFVIKGVNLGPNDISIAKSAFQDTSLSGTSIAVTVNGVTVAPLIYYTSATQVAALLPSNTPTGTGTITVTYNGRTGTPANIGVVANTLGIFTASSDGNGAGIVTYPDYSLVSTTKAANCGGVFTTCGAANPGDVLIIWATGLGAINGSDAAGAGLGVNQTSLPLTVWLGNVQVTASYQGRSGCCIGEDQIVFTVPANTPTGCSVPLSVQIGNAISNNVALAVAPAGSRSCSMVNPALNTANLGQISTTGKFTFGSVDLRREDLLPGFRDRVVAQFIRLSVPPAARPFFLSAVDTPPVGTCFVYNSINGQPDPPLDGADGLDAGAQLTIQAPNGSKTAPGGGGDYRTILSETGNYFSPGTITVSAAGGSDVPAFTTSLTLPAMPTMTSPPPDAASPIVVTRSNGLTVTWSGALANGYIELSGGSATDASFNDGVSFSCTAAGTSNTFTIPPSVLMALPATNFGFLNFHPNVRPVAFTGTNLNVTEMSLFYENSASLAFR